MGECALGRHHLEQLSHALDFTPRNASPAHPSIDREVPGAATGAPPRLNFVGKTEGRGEPRGTRALQIVLQQRREDDNRFSDPRLTQLLPLIDTRNAISPRLQRLERTHDLPDAEAVCVGLYHWQQRNSGATRDGSRVSLDRTGVDLQPRAGQRKAHYPLGYVARVRAANSSKETVPPPGHAMTETHFLDDTLALMRDLRARC